MYVYARLSSCHMELFLVSPTEAPASTAYTERTARLMRCNARTAIHRFSSSGKRNIVGVDVVRDDGSTQKMAAAEEKKNRYTALLSEVRDE